MPLLTERRTFARASPQCSTVAYGRYNSDAGPRVIPKLSPHPVHTIHMFYIPHTQPYDRPPEYNPYGYPPRRPRSIYDDFVEATRRGYLEALHQQQQLREYEHAVALENQHHRAQLAALAEREVLRKRRSPYQTQPFLNTGANDAQFMRTPRHDDGRRQTARLY